MQLRMLKIFTLSILTKCVMLNILCELKLLPSQETACKCQFKSMVQKRAAFHGSHPLQWSWARFSLFKHPPQKELRREHSSTCSGSEQHKLWRSQWSALRSREGWRRARQRLELMGGFGDLPGEIYLGTTGAFASTWSSAALSLRNTAMFALPYTTFWGQVSGYRWADLIPTCLWQGSPASCCPASTPTSLAAFPVQQHHRHPSDFRELNWQ